MDATPRVPPMPGMSLPWPEVGQPPSSPTGLHGGRIATAHSAAKFASKKHQGRAGWESRRTALAARCRLIRDIVYAPLPPLSACLLAWNGGLLVNLAQAAYEYRSLPSGHLDNARMAVLGDALEEAGCTDATLLTHLRLPAVHVRGCWAVD